MKTAFLTGCLIFLSFEVLSQPGTFSFEKTYDTGTNPTLSVNAEDSDIRVHSSDNNQITVHFIAKRNNELIDIDLAELNEYFRIKIEKTNEGLQIESRSKQKNNFGNWHDRISLDFEIEAPIKTACNIGTVDGDVQLTGLTANQQCKTVDGDIEIQKITGDLVVSTVDGDVETNETTGNIVLSTVDGDLKLENITGNIRMKTIDGDIQFRDVDGEINCAATDGDIKGSLIALKAPCQCNTADGDIYIKIPGESGFDIEMKGESVHTDFKNFDGDIAKKHIKGKVNGGGVLVTLTSTDGNIELVLD